MEELLVQIITISNNFPEIEKAAQEAVDFLRIQQGLIRDPAYELREKCLAVLQLCLETKRSKFTSLAVAGFQNIIKDDRFHTSIEPEDDSKWLPHQLLQSIKSFSSLSDDVQVDLLKVLLSIACSRMWTINGRTVISIISLCSEEFESGNAAIRAAAQAAASQTLRSFCLLLVEELEEGGQDATNFNEILPVMQFICSRIDEAECSSHCEHGVEFLLECLLTLCTSLPQSVCTNQHINAFLWQKFCPVLISVLGTPKVDKNIVTRISGVEKERGRGSGGLKTAPSFNSVHAKTVYSINTELVRLFGSITSLRPVLESLFHRVLLYPAPEHRVDALRSATELIRNENRLLDITGPLVQEKENSLICDTSLLRLIMDSVEECSKSEFSVAQASVMCCFGLLKAVGVLCLGHCIPPKVAESICSLYPNIVDCDYTGPKTYQSTRRLPQQYRERIEREFELLRQAQADSQKRDYESDSSCDTEGPEEDEKEQNSDSETTDEKKIPINIEPYEMPTGLGDTDRQYARHFFAALHELLPLLMPLRSSIQVDQALQSFASQYCEGVVAQQRGTQWSAVNADGVYLAVYSALVLDMRLFQANYHSSPKRQMPMTEDEFVKKVQGIGVVAYLSRVWLRELYQLVVASSLLEKHGYLPTNQNSQSHALINLITDVEGWESCMQGSQLLWECRRLKNHKNIDGDNFEEEAGLRLSRRILTCCWDTLLKVLAIPLTQKRFKSSRRDLKLRNMKFLVGEKSHRSVKHVVKTSIEGLQVLARLCSKLGLQDRCDSILELLAAASCSEPEKEKARLLQAPRADVVRLTPSDSLSLELLLGSGLELGSHCSDCWPHVFRCCLYVRTLEHKYFSKSENRALGSMTKVTRKEGDAIVHKDSDLTFDPQLEDDSCVDVYSFLCSSELPQTVSEIISGSTDVLKPSHTAKVICVLSQLVDKLFEEAALKLNLKALESFATALWVCSHEQLFPPLTKAKGLQKRFWWHRFTKITEPSNDILLLDSVGEIMLKCVRSGRPLYHIIRIWTILGPHLMEAACHKDLAVSRKAVKHIHDSVNAVLSDHTELSHFHVNETLFKPFENLLCLDLCEPDVQDQIVGCICEFVEANFKEIRSGWRPLFGALRAVSSNVNSLLDVFRVFLETDNALLFSYAAIDFIMCLLKHFRVQSSGNNNTEIGLETLKHLKRCEAILSSIYKMPQRVIFQSARHIQVSDGLLVDPIMIDFEIFYSDQIPEDMKFSSELLSPGTESPLNECKPSLDDIDSNSGVLRVWFLLLEGMHSAAISANSAFQPSLLDMLYSDLGKLIDDPGPVFGLIVFNRLVLPMTQSWLRQLSKVQEASFSGLKQSMGLLSDLILQYFDRLRNDETCENLLSLLLKQALFLLSECSIHPIPEVAKIGPACIRHIILNAGRYFTEKQWKCVTTSLQRLCTTTLMYLRQLMIPFSKDSQYYYGDSEQVKVAARKAVSDRDIRNSLQLSNRVFLLDEQYESIGLCPNENLNEQKIYTFLVHNTEDEVVRIPMKSLVIALHAHQSVLQIIADVLLQGTEHRLPCLANLVSNGKSSGFYNNTRGDFGSNMPGLMDHINLADYRRLLSCLDYSYHCAIAFDSRPGLKFLLQKVAGLDQAANLYRQVGAAWAIKLVSLFEYSLVSLRRHGLSTEDVKGFLENPQTSSETDLKFFIRKFRNDFDELCKTYVDIVLNNDGSVSENDKPERSLFFLVESRDDEDPDREETKRCSDGENEKDSDGDDKMNDGEKSSKVEKNPFFLSDFSKASISDSDENSFDDRTNCLAANESNGEETEPGSLEENGDYMPQAREKSKKTEDKKDLEDSMMKVLKEYKKKKKKFSTAPRKIVLPVRQNEPPVPPEIEQQRRRSFLKDSEALRHAWTAMLGSVFELLQSLDDDDFRKLLPVYIDGVRRLMAHVGEPALKLAVSEFFQRIAVIYGFGMI